MKPARLLPVIFLALAACDNSSQTIAPTANDKAVELAHNLLVVDTHIDVPYRLEEHFEDVTQATPAGDFDYPRAKAGGLDVAFMSIYTPANYEFEGTDKATRHANTMIDLVEDIVAKAPKRFVLAKSTKDVLAAKEAGKIALPLGMENGAPLAGNMENLYHFHDRGVRYITLAHSKANHISDSSYDTNHLNGGLSPFGVALIHEMNNMGIMVDVSHISDDAFWAVLEESAAPVIASHSSARHFTPGFERNMSDEMIDALGKAGGVIMINYGSAFLTEEANAYGGKQNAAYEDWLQMNAVADNEAAKEAFAKRYRTENPYPYADLSDVLDHIDHAVAIAGINAVGIGSDYDGVGDSLPTGLKDVSSYPNLVEGLLERGYSEADIEKILGTNLMRVWKAVEDYAESRTTG